MAFTGGPPSVGRVLPTARCGPPILIIWVEKRNVSNGHYALT